MKKAAEVDFTWAAFPRTYEKRLLGSAPQVGGERLENLGLRHDYLTCFAGPRASGGIDVVMTAKQTFTTGPRRVQRGPRRFACWLTNDHHDDVHPELDILYGQDLFFRNC